MRLQNYLNEGLIDKLKKLFVKKKDDSFIPDKAYNAIAAVLKTKGLTPEALGRVQGEPNLFSVQDNKGKHWVVTVYPDRSPSTMVQVRKRPK